MAKKRRTKRSGFSSKIKGKDAFKVVRYSLPRRWREYYGQLNAALFDARIESEKHPRTSVVVFRNSNGKFKKLAKFKGGRKVAR